MNKKNRVQCAVPFCHGTFEGTDEQEGLCNRHWRAAAGPIRRRYAAAWAEADRADRIGVEDLESFVRVTNAFRELVAYAIGVGR